MANALLYKPQDRNAREKFMTTFYEEAIPPNHVPLATKETSKLSFNEYVLHEVFAPMALLSKELSAQFPYERYRTGGNVAASTEDNQYPFTIHDGAYLELLRIDANAHSILDYCINARIRLSPKLRHDLIKLRTLVTKLSRRPPLDANRHAALQRQYPYLANKWRKISAKMTKEFAALKEKTTNQDRLALLQLIEAHVDPKRLKIEDRGYGWPDLMFGAINLEITEILGDASKLREVLAPILAMTKPAESEAQAKRNAEHAQSIVSKRKMGIEPLFVPKVADDKARTIAEEVFAVGQPHGEGAPSPTFSAWVSSEQKRVARWKSYHYGVVPDWWRAQLTNFADERAEKPLTVADFRDFLTDVLARLP